MYDYTDNPLAWLFFLSSLSFYVSLAIIGPLPGTDPVLFVEVVNQAKIAPIIWGWLGIASLMISMVGIYFYNKLLIKIFSAMQLSLWVYAGVSYLMAGAIPLFTGVALVHILFWGWNYADRKTVKDRRMKEMLGLTD